MVENSNMTNAECYQMNGALSAERIKRLIEMEETAPDVERAVAGLEGAVIGDDLADEIEKIAGVLANWRESYNEINPAEAFNALDSALAELTNSFDRLRHGVNSSVNDVSGILGGQS